MQHKAGHVLEIPIGNYSATSYLAKPSACKLVQHSKTEKLRQLDVVHICVDICNQIDPGPTRSGCDRWISASNLGAFPTVGVIHGSRFLPALQLGKT